MADKYAIYWPEGTLAAEYVSDWPTREEAEAHAARLDEVVAPGHFVQPEIRTADAEELRTIIKWHQTRHHPLPMFTYERALQRLRLLKAEQKAAKMRAHAENEGANARNYAVALREALTVIDEASTLDEAIEKIGQLNIREGGPDLWAWFDRRKAPRELVAQ